MNQTHIHLLITHLPIFGSMLGGIVLAFGLWKKSDDTKIAAYLIFIISAIGAGTAYLTGEAAEHTVRDIQGVLKETIETHEESAMYALISLIVLGLASIIGSFLTIKKSPMTRTIAFTILIVAIISFGLVVRTGYLGGQIRHTELSNNIIDPSLPSDKETDD